MHAVDTGAGQIDWKLRTDSRVVLHERINARHLTFEEIGESASFIACDVSFISVTLLLPALAPLLLRDGDWVILVKPQFEAGREYVGKGGIVRDPQVQHPGGRRESIENACFARFTTALIASPLLGAEGNLASFCYMRAPGASLV